MQFFIWPIRVHATPSHAADGTSYILYSNHDKIREGEKINVQIEGTSRTTTLKIDGKLIDQLEPKMRYFSCGKDSMLYFRTLVFPLEEAGHFKSRVENLKVYNYCKE